MATKDVKILDINFHISLKLNDLPTSVVVGISASPNSTLIWTSRPRVKCWSKSSSRHLGLCGSSANSMRPWVCTGRYGLETRHALRPVWGYDPRERRVGPIGRICRQRVSSSTCGELLLLGGEVMHKPTYLTAAGPLVPPPLLQEV